MNRDRRHSCILPFSRASHRQIRACCIFQLFLSWYKKHIVKGNRASVVAHDLAVRCQITLCFASHRSRLHRSLWDAQAEDFESEKTPSPQFARLTTSSAVGKFWNRPFHPLHWLSNFLPYSDPESGNQVKMTGEVIVGMLAIAACLAECGADSFLCCAYFLFVFTLLCIRRVWTDVITNDNFCAYIFPVTFYFSVHTNMWTSVIFNDICGHMWTYVISNDIVDMCRHMSLETTYVHIVWHVMSYGK